MGLSILEEKNVIIDVNDDSIIFPLEYIFYDNSDKSDNNEKINLFNISKIRSNQFYNKDNLVFNDYNLLNGELSSFNNRDTYVLYLAENKENVSNNNIERLKMINSKIRVVINLNLEIAIEQLVVDGNIKYFNRNFVCKKYKRIFYENNSNLYYGVLGPLDCCIMGFNKNNNLKEYLLGVFDFILFSNCPLLVKYYDLHNLNILINIIIDNYSQDEYNIIAGRIYVYNLKLNIIIEESDISEGNIIKQIKNTVINTTEIAQILKQKINIIFELSEIDNKGLNPIIFFKNIFQLFKDNIKNILVSPGIKYKSNLKQYGGIGYDIINIFKDNNLLNKYYNTLNNNNINFLKWFQIKENKPTFKFPIKCSNCGILFDKTETKISKNDKEFCSIDCFKIFIKK